MKRVLTIAGFDPSGRAGISADLKTFDDLGVEGVAAITALTAQNSTTVAATLPIEPKFVRKEIVTLLAEVGFDAIKIGMLGSSETVTMLARFLKKERIEKVVLDPVLRSTSGTWLIDKNGLEEIKKLLPLVHVVTPNIDEAGALTKKKIQNVTDMEEAAKTIHSLGVKFVLLKGGHLKGAPTDVLFNGKDFTHYSGTRLGGSKARFHGTGCILSAALCANLAKGVSVKKSTENARKYLTKVLKTRK